MKIAYLTDQVLPQTATDTAQLMAMVSAFGAAGADVTLVTPHRFGRPDPTRDALCAYYEVAPTFRVRFVPSVYPSVRGLEKAAQGIVGPWSEAARGADVVYTRNLPIVGPALLLRRTPVAYETYRPWPRQKPWSARFFRHLGRQPGFAGAILHSRLALDSYVASDVPAHKLLVAHNGYDPRQIEPRLSRREARHQVGLQMEGRVVCYAGRIGLRKGIGTVLDMAAALPDVRFVLVGSEGHGPIEQRAATMANVTMVPWQPFTRTLPYLYASDVLLIPPTRGPLEKTGNTVLPIKTFLYMATGRAILGPATPDLRELLHDGQNARLIPPDDVGAAVHALREMLDNELLRERLGEQARADVALLTWHSRASKILAFLDERLAALPRGR
jgi:glycosyltransferase involved in cell wall biosynthesis